MVKRVITPRRVGGEVSAVPLRSVTAIEKPLRAAGGAVPRSKEVPRPWAVRMFWLAVRLARAVTEKLGSRELPEAGAKM
jgi:hypothetical protein